jgi:hypothetical protein
MNADRVSLVIISDFTATNLATTLQHVADLPAVDAVIAPSGQPTQVLLDDDSMAWSGDRDAALIWVRPEGISSALSAAQSGTALDRDLLRAEVTTFANAIKRAAKRLRYCFLATLTVPWYQRAPAQSVAQSDGGIGRAVSLANECLITELAGTPSGGLTGRRQATMTSSGILPRCHSLQLSSVRLLLMCSHCCADCWDSQGS